MKDDIYSAAERGNLAALQVLCDRDPTIVNLPDSHGSTALHYAAEGRQLAAANCLLRLGADPAIRDQMGYTPLHWCAVVNASDVAALLLATGVNADIVGEMVEHHPGATPLEIAAMRGHLETAQCLLESGATASKVMPDGGTALHRACAGTTAASYTGPERRERVLSMLKLLLSNGATIEQLNAAGQTSLHAAVSGGDRVCVDFLLEQGADVNASDGLGMTPLHCLAQGIHVIENRANELLIAESLLRAGAGVDTHDAIGETPLDIATRLDRADLAAAMRRWSGESSHAAADTDEGD